MRDEHVRKDTDPSYLSCACQNFTDIGNAAAFDLPFLPEAVGSFAGGLIAMYAWRSFYLSESVSMRTRVLLFTDYIKRGVS